MCCCKAVFPLSPSPSPPFPPPLPSPLRPSPLFTQSSCTVGTGAKVDHSSHPSLGRSTWLSPCYWTLHQTSKEGAGLAHPLAGPPVTPPLSTLDSFELVKSCIDELRGLWHSQDHVHPPSEGAVRHFFYEARRTALCSSVALHEHLWIVPVSLIMCCGCWLH